MREFVRWQITTLPSGAVGMMGLADAALGDCTGAAVMTSAAIHSWKRGNPAVRTCWKVMLLTSSLATKNSDAPSVSVPFPVSVPVAESQFGRSVPLAS